MAPVRSPGASRLGSEGCDGVRRGGPDGEDAIQPGEFEKHLNSLLQAGEAEIAGAAAKGADERDQSAEAGTIHEFHGGQVEKVKWSKDGVEGLPTFTAKDGSEVKIPAGHVWISLVPKGGESVSAGSVSWSK